MICLSDGISPVGLESTESLQEGIGTSLSQLDQSYCYIFDQSGAILLHECRPRIFPSFLLWRLCDICGLGSRVSGCTEVMLVTDTRTAGALRITDDTKTTLPHFSPSVFPFSRKMFSSVL